MPKPKKNAEPDTPKPFILRIESPAALRDMTGTKRPRLQNSFITQIRETLWLPVGLSELDQVNLIQSALEMLQGILPRDELEGMLAVQMVATHHAAVECLRRAMLPGQTSEGRDQNLKHAAKLLGLFSRQLEGLDKHRGKGQQKVTVEHVYVGSGGQAIVGNVETGGNDVVQHEKCPASVTPNPVRGVPLDGAKFKPVKVCPKP